MQHTDKAIAEFEAAFVAGMVEEFGEGYRSSAEYMLTDGSVIAKYAKWAWFASRRGLVIELPRPDTNMHNGRSDAACELLLEQWDADRAAIEAAGVTVRG